MCLFQTVRCESDRRFDHFALLLTVAWDDDRLGGANAKPAQDVQHSKKIAVLNKRLASNQRSATTGAAAPPHVAHQRSAAKCAAVKDAAKYAPAKNERVIPGPNYTIPGTLTTVALASVVAHNYALAGITGILGVFLAIQASRVQFIFDKDALVRSTACTYNAVEMLQPSKLRAAVVDRFMDQLQTQMPQPSQAREPLRLRTTHNEK